MGRRYLSIWFRHLLTDGLARRRPELKGLPFVLVAPVKNRVVITGASGQAEQQGVAVGMAAVDARAAIAELVCIDAVPGQGAKLLRLLGLGCIRFTPVVALDPPDGLLLDISGCTHLWGGEVGYLKAINSQLGKAGFHARFAIADTPGAAWAAVHYGDRIVLVEPGKQASVIATLSPAALRLEADVLDKLQKLGFNTVAPLLSLPPQMLRRRFGKTLQLRIDQALGRSEEYLLPLEVPVPYMERLPRFEPVRTVPAIELAIEELLSALCFRLKTEGKGLRKAFLKCHRIDGRKVQVGITTTKGSHSVSHLMRLFKLQVAKIEPALGIELFVLEAPVVEDMETVQESLWAEAKGLGDTALAKLLDRIAGKVGAHAICRFLPAEQHWPERAVRVAGSLNEEPEVSWPVHLRPMRMLETPEMIEVMALVPDHPPKLFVYKGKRHVIAKADGPERISREWWRDKGEHRDYYALEDTDGQRYWVFRSGHYDGADARWYLHGFFA